MANINVAEKLREAGAVHEDKHFRYTSTNHGPAYIDMRVIGHDTQTMHQIGLQLAELIRPYQVDLVIGPKTLGQLLAFSAALRLDCSGIWCEMDEIDGDKVASFSEKLPTFAPSVDGKRIAITDDLLTTGSSIKAVAKLVVEHGGIPVVAAVAVRRTPDILAAHCGTESLEIIEDFEGFVVFTPEECQAHGPCSQRVPMMPRPGHGYRWLEEHPDYPSA